MLRRKLTRIELNADDLAEYTQKQQQNAEKNNNSSGGAVHKPSSTAESAEDKQKRVHDRIGYTAQQQQRSAQLS